mgnify:CR=1 FL=1
MIKTGIDIVHNMKMKSHLSVDSFLNKVFHFSELKNKEKLIGIFALKEAVMKAIGKKVDWKFIEISFPKGKPNIFLSDDIKTDSIKSIDGSISHDGEYTVAIVVIEI